MNIDKKANFLATCLLESLEDEDIRAARLFLEKYDCSPNTIIFGRGIAPIHYACGMENLQIAGEITEVMLKHGGDPNVMSEDGMTPLHVACLTGHSGIVKMLLEHGGDIHIIDNEKKTPVLYAVHEHQFEVIKTIQNFVFEKKIADKEQELFISASKLNYQSPKNKNLLSIQHLEEKKFTPNRVHYNFDATSPYYIYITHRKSNATNPIQPVRLNEMPSPLRETAGEKENLFKLTEENLDKFSEQLAPVQSKMSLIQMWREKVQKSRHRSSILKVFNDIDELLDGVMTEETLNFTNTLLEPTGNQKEKPTRSGKSIATFLENTVKHETDLSFVTAENNVEINNVDLNESNFIRSPKGGQYVMQVAETYAHTDDENGLVFYEMRLHSNPGGKPKDGNKGRYSESTNFTLPPDYDTDALRAELTTFGHIPGPITKSTKRLYIKRLIKYKRKVESGEQVDDQSHEQKFSIELERTVQKKDWFDRIHEHMHLEKAINEHFHLNGQKRKFREGNMKTSFIYLLIDPRISRNLPGEFKYMTQHDVWRKFLNAIFYVGKGKSSRPYSHLYDAMKTFSRNREQFDINGFLESKPTEIPRKHTSRSAHQSQSKLNESKKLQRILDIWQSKRGVVCLHVFHNIMPAEAYTREAAIIDALGLKHLTNLKRGDYYGPCQTWTMRTKKFLGIALLFKAMQIFLAEGESQLTPSDLI